MNHPLTPSEPPPSHLASPWAPPRLSMRWWPVFARNLRVWRKLVIPSLLANIGEPLLWLVAFGYGLGAMIGRVPTHGQDVPYILFLASGSVCMSAMNAASFEALYSAFSRMHVQKTWDGILNTPVQLDDVVLAEMLWAGFKALFSATVILAVIWALGISRAPRTLLALPVLLATGILGVMLALQISHSPKLLLVLPILLLAGITAASMALVFNAKAKGYDFFSYYFAVLLSPMMFLSGVFFPREQLPPFAHAIANWLPLSAVVDLVRPLFLDQWPANAGRHLAVLAAYAIVGFWVALAFTRQRFRR